MNIVSPLLLGCLAVFMVGCGGAEGNKRATRKEPPAAEVNFHDNITWETPAPMSLQEILFRDGEGNEVDLKQYQEKKNVVLVITRGFQKGNYYKAGVCAYCTTQTSRFIANYEQFRERNTEVVVVFPIENQSQSKQRETLVTKAQSLLKQPVESVPFPVWLDAELQVVKHLGIEADLSKPATYVLDRAGQVRFAYVGASLADRPSVKAIMAKLDEINREKK